MGKDGKYALELPLEEEKRLSAQDYFMEEAEAEAREMTKQTDKRVFRPISSPILENDL